MRLRGLINSLPILRDLMFLLWILSIVIFLILQKLAPSNYGGIVRDSFATLIATNILSGVLFFLFACLLTITTTIYKKKISKKHSKNVTIGKHTFSSNLLLNTLGMAYLTLALIATNHVLSNKVTQNLPTTISDNSVDTTPIPSDTSTPTLPPIPTKYIAYDDQLTSCKLTEACGSKVITLTRKQCSDSVCCQIGNNYYFYENIDKCKRDQSTQYNNSLVSCIGVTGTTYHLPPDQCNQITNLRLLVEEAKLSTQQAISEMDSIVTNTQYYLDNIVNEPYPTITPLPDNIYGNWAPTPFTAPGSTCYATWEDYFQAHPTYSSNNISQVGSPPCD